MIFLLKPHVRRVSIAFRVVRRVSARGMQRNRNSFSLVSLFFCCFRCYYYRYYFWTAVLRCYKPDRRWSSRCQVGAERRAAARTHDGEKRKERQGRMEGGYMRVSPCIILRSFEKPKATTGCVALVALPIGT